MGVAIARVLIGGFGLLLILGGIGVAALTGPGGDMVSALSLFVPGAIIIAAVALERTRYRSLHAERTGDAHGPGGGEPHQPDPRFRPTVERFVDPTTGVPMQVWVDPATGERRYVPLG
ncbi:MAG TPA: hypothetical protein VGK16_05960 [Candidatus Limnocylindrales bacterium]|jgi:hypothetical protein